MRGDGSHLLAVEAMLLLKLKIRFQMLRSSR